MTPEIKNVPPEVEKLYELAEESWEGCDGCDDNDKHFWMNGFRAGYNRAIPDVISDEEALRLAKKMNKQPLIFVPSEISEKYQQYRDWLNEIPEISDEEILEAAAKNFNKEALVEGICINYVLQCAFIEGAKWYREQLKK
jgi:hypothetical protein